jgi:predicted phage-related endonuclease
MNSVINISSQTAGRDIYNIAGDLNITQNSSPEEVLKIIQAIQQKVGELDISDKDKKKISNHLDNVKIELEEKEPDKKSIEESIKSANGILKEAKATGETLKEIGVMVVKAAVWLETTKVALGWIF